MAKREDIIKGGNTHPTDKVMKVTIHAERIPLSEVPEEIKEQIKKKVPMKKVKGSNPFANKLKEMLKGDND